MKLTLKELRAVEEAINRVLAGEPEHDEEDRPAMQRALKKVQAALSTKMCRRCKTAPWTCRTCGTRCCEHFCSLKKADGTATCGTCRLRPDLYTR